MKTSQDKLLIAMRLIKAQSDLLALHYKVDKTEYSEDQIKRFDRLENERDYYIKEMEEALCTCDDYGVFGKHHCPLHVKTEG